MTSKNLKNNSKNRNQPSLDMFFHELLEVKNNLI